MEHQGRRQSLHSLLMAGDLLTMALCLDLAFHWSRGQFRLTSFSELLNLQLRGRHLVAAGLCVLFCHLAFAVFGLYHSRRLSTRSAEALDAVKAAVVSSLFIFCILRWLHLSFVSWQYLLKLVLLFAAAAAFSRLLVRLLLNGVRSLGRNLRHMLVIGTNSRALRFAAQIEDRPWLGYHLLGFVDDDSAPCLEEFRASGRVRVCDFANFEAYLKSHLVDEAVICLPMRSYYHQAERIATLCQEQGVIVRVSSDLFDFGLPYVRKDSVEDNTLITVAGRPHGWAMAVKTLLDRFLSLVLLIFFSPLMLAAAILIKLSGPGPVLFVQERVGLNKRRFRLLKFRTMIPGAERRQNELEALNETTGPVFKIREDPRITAIGRILRKYSIDELPQLINVLLGEMSLVGPRPLPVRDYQGFTSAWHFRRFSIRPGISCLWQIAGRSTIDFEDWMKLDMQYIDQWSLWLDLKILAKTIGAVIKGAGAW